MEFPSGSDQCNVTSIVAEVRRTKLLAPNEWSVYPGGSGVPAAPAGLKSPSQVPDVPLVRLPELPAEEKYSAPSWVTSFTACAITPSWKAGSSL